MSGRIVARGLSKAYRRYPSAWARLAEWMSPGRAPRHALHWVLSDLDFAIGAGETVGVIGINGAGKSTLLKIIAGITAATRGSVEVSGRIASILELGLGFHPDFTGLQNVVVAGQLLGLTEAEVRARVPEIEEFAEIGSAFHEPTRTYSSGMHARLAFSVATAVRPDVLIIDEVLSVGDAYFQYKSFERIRRFRAEGTTLLFVSHNESVVKSICDRAILLDGGVLLRDGTPDEVLDYYNAAIARREAEYEIRVSRGEKVASTRSGNRRAEVSSVDLLSAAGESARVLPVGERAAIRVCVTASEDLPALTIGILVRDVLGNAVFGTNTYHLGHQLGAVKAGQSFVVDFDFDRFDIGTGGYALSVAAHADMTHVAGNYDWWDHALSFQMIPGRRPHSVGVVALECRCRLDAIEWRSEVPTAVAAH